MASIDNKVIASGICEWYRYYNLNSTGRVEERTGKIKKVICGYCDGTFETGSSLGCNSYHVRDVTNIGEKVNG